MIKIRHAVFETNSSSTHSISISQPFCLKMMSDTIFPDSEGKIFLSGGEFGWEEESFTDALTKANYCAVDVQNDPAKLAMLTRVIAWHTGAKEIVYRLGDSYIDHQSCGTSKEAFQDEYSLRSFIFNPNSELRTDNDNH